MSDQRLTDDECFDLGRALRHRVGNCHSCKCAECRAIKRVVALAREAAARKGYSAFLRMQEKRAAEANV